MPQLLIRGLDRATVTAVRDYGRARGLSTPDAAAELLARGLDHVRQQAARQAGAAATNRQPQAARSEAARKAATARWAKRANARP